MIDILVTALLLLFVCLVYYVVGIFILLCVNEFERGQSSNPLSTLTILAFWPIIMFGYPIVLLIKYLAKNVKFRKKSPNLTKLLETLHEITVNHDADVYIELRRSGTFVFPYNIRITKGDRTKTIRFLNFSKDDIDSDVVSVAIENRIRELEEEKE